MGFLQSILVVGILMHEEASALLLNLMDSSIVYISLEQFSKLFEQQQSSVWFR